MALVAKGARGFVHEGGLSSRAPGQRVQGAGSARGEVAGWMRVAVRVGGSSSGPDAPLIARLLASSSAPANTLAAAINALSRCSARVEYRQGPPRKAPSKRTSSASAGVATRGIGANRAANAVRWIETQLVSCSSQT